MWADVHTTKCPSPSGRELNIGVPEETVKHKHRDLGCSPCLESSGVYWTHYRLERNLSNATKAFCTSLVFWDSENQSCFCVRKEGVRSLEHEGLLGTLGLEIVLCQLKGGWMNGKHQWLVPGAWWPCGQEGCWWKDGKQGLRFFLSPNFSFLIPSTLSYSREKRNYWVTSHQLC